jgi:hypothetical protein
LDTLTLDTLIGVTITTWLELLEDFEINENIDEFYDLEEGIEDEDGMIQDSDFNDWDDDDPDNDDDVFDLEDDVHDE